VYALEIDKLWIPVIEVLYEAAPDKARPSQEALSRSVGTVGRREQLVASTHSFGRCQQLEADTFAPVNLRDHEHRNEPMMEEVMRDNNESDYPVVDDCYETAPLHDRGFDQFATVCV
jgi:hypothetical protein